MKNYNKKGYISAAIAAISYGTNPLFALPMIFSGIKVNSILFYRYFFAIIIYGLWLKLYKKKSLKISKKELFILIFLGIIFSLSSLFLFEAFNYMDAGLACTILFAYPLIVAIISKFIFKEQISKSVWLSLCAVLFGITLLYTGKPEEHLSIIGIVFVLLSSLSYAIYMVGIKHIKAIRHMKKDKMTFYVMLLGLSVYILNLGFCTKLQPLNSTLTIICAIMLAIFPTIISLEAINIGIKLIGPTKTAILGALEPITALFFGVIIFKQILTIKISFGIILIISEVIFVISQNNKSTKHDLQKNFE